MRRSIHSDSGLERNAHGRFYRRGSEYTTFHKLEAEELYWSIVTRDRGRHPGQREFARECRVSQTYARKVIAEIKIRGMVRSVEDLKEERWDQRNKGVGCRCLTNTDVGVLLQLRHLNPARSSISYVRHLRHLTGTLVSTSFISQFFKKIGPFEGNLRVINRVPADKYRPSNIVTYADYLSYVQQLKILHLWFYLIFHTMM